MTVQELRDILNKIIENDQGDVDIEIRHNGWGELSRSAGSLDSITYQEDMMVFLVE